jgi:hypothetical protein
MCPPASQPRPVRKLGKMKAPLRVAPVKAPKTPVQKKAPKVEPLERMGEMVAPQQNGEREKGRRLPRAGEER